MVVELHLPFRNLGPRAERITMRMSGSPEIYITQPLARS
jgi:hypothetical protein